MQHQNQQPMQQQEYGAPPLLPPGWIAATAPDTGMIYYANPTTGETSWEPPPVVVPLPPPPPVMQQPPPPPKRINELEVSAGQIADLCHRQPNHEPYQMPLESHLLSAQPPHTEEARLEIRLATLYDQLKRQSAS